MGKGGGGWKGKGEQKVTFKLVQSLDRKMNFSSPCYLVFFTGVVLTQAGIFGFFRREKISR